MFCQQLRNVSDISRGHNLDTVQFELATQSEIGSLVSIQSSMGFWMPSNSYRLDPETSLFNASLSSADPLFPSENDAAPTVQRINSSIYTRMSSTVLRILHRSNSIEGHSRNAPLSSSHSLEHEASLLEPTDSI